MFKRVLATVLTILMLLSVIPATLISATVLPGTIQIQPSYYLDDNNGIRWYFFDVYGWFFQFGYNYSDSLNDYAVLKPNAAPTTGYMYSVSTGNSVGYCKYISGTGWEVTYQAGGAPGFGGGFAAMSGYTIEDNNGATWLNVSGTWVYIMNPLYALYGDLEDYRDKFGVNPENGTVRDANGRVCNYASFNSATGTWSFNANGGFGQQTAIGYTIFDGRATWSVMANVWMFVATLSNGQQISGDADEYKSTFGEYPTTGTATDKDGKFVSYCEFNEATKSWSYSYGPNAGISSFDYIIDNNNVCWAYNVNAWNFLKADSTWGTVSDYYAAYKKYPISGTAYTVQGTVVAECTFDFRAFSWTVNTTTGGTTTTIYSYIVDNNTKVWVNKDNAWCYVKADNTYGTVSDYVREFGVLPETGFAYNDSSVPVADCVFNGATGSWTVGTSNMPGTSLSYYLVDNLGVYWYYQNGAWCIQTATGFGGAAEYIRIYGKLPMTATLYGAGGVNSGMYLFNTTTYTWEPLGNYDTPDWNNPGNSGSGIVSDGHYSGQLSDPNLGLKVYDTNNRLWTKSGSTWTSLHSSYYTTANPARYIDSTNRVWEMRNSRWVLNPNAKPNEGEVVVPPTSGTVNPNSLPSLTDTKGYTWTKSGSTWTSTAAAYYNVMGVIPEYKANDNSIWVLNNTNTSWTLKTSGSQTPSTPSTPSTPTTPESISGYTAYVFDGKTYQVPNHTVEIVPGPGTMPYKPEGYEWLTYNGQYTLLNRNTGDIYPIPTLYQLPANYYYYPTYDKENPWRIVGNGTFANSTITSIELTDYPYKLEVGKTYQCKADFTCEADNKGLSTILIWSSTNPEVATVDQTGKVTIVGVGKAYIKVRAFLGFVETQIDIYGIEGDVKPQDKPTQPDQPVTPPDEPVTPPVVTTPVSDIFTDVSENAPYTEYIQYVYDNEIFKGMSETVFGPESSMTRAQFYTVLSRMAGYTDAELKAKYPSTKFADSQDKWFTAAVEWAYTEGLDGGVGAMQIKDANGQLVWVENCFNPDGAIKREDACAALYNFAIKYHHVYFGQPYNISFADASSVNWWAQPAVSSFSQLGILSGHIIDSGNNFRPEDPATRSDIATIIARYAMLYMK